MGKMFYGNLIKNTRSQWSN